MRCFFVYLAILFLVVHCTTQPARDGEHSDKGVWQGTAAMVSEASSSKKWVYVLWASDAENQRMRIDITAAFDIPIATYIQNSDGAHLWLYREKKHYYSVHPAKLFKQLTKVSLDPKIFYSLLGVPQHPGKGWFCEKNKHPFHCQSKALKTDVAVDWKSIDQRLIRIKNAGKALRIKLSRAKVGVGGVKFTPFKASQYKTIEI